MPDTPTAQDELYKLYGVDNDEALLAAIREDHTQAEALRTDTSLAAQEKNFAADYPDLWKQMQEDRSKAQLADADKFVGSVRMIGRMDGDKIVPTNFGLSQLAEEAVRDAYLSSASGNLSLEAFTNVIKTITQGGTVQFGETGSSRETPTPEYDLSTSTGQKQVRMAFAEKVNEVMKSDNLAYADAIRVAGEKYPDLARDYMAAKPVHK